MKHTFVVTPDGEEIVMISKADFDQIEDRLDVAAYDAAKAEIATAGEMTLDSEDMKALLAAPTALAFRRAKRGGTQTALGQAVGIGQSYVAALENGARKGDPSIFKRLAVALWVRMEDIAEG